MDLFASLSSRLGYAWTFGLGRPTASEDGDFQETAHKTPQTLSSIRVPPCFVSRRLVHRGRLYRALGLVADAFHSKKGLGLFILRFHNYHSLEVPSDSHTA
jgi:hypothetical protein